MESTTEITIEQEQACKEDILNDKADLLQRLERATPSARKMEKAKEILSKIDPVKFKELTGIDLARK